MTASYRIRPIEDADLPAVIDILCEGFPRRDAAYWRAGLARLAARQVPEGMEKYGYVIEDDGPKGVVLAISSLHAGEGEAPRVFTNISSWCVLSSHRGPAAKALYQHAARHPEVTSTNLSAAAHTLKTLDRFGFQPWSTGQTVGIATGRRGGARVLGPGAALAAGLDRATHRILADHAAMGCEAFCLETAAGLVPLVFLQRKVRGWIPAAQLIYCQDLNALLAEGRAAWLHLLRRGLPLLILDASGPLDGIRGKFYPGRAAKYFRGPRPVHAVDHTYSEMVYLGF